MAVLGPAAEHGGALAQLFETFWLNKRHSRAVAVGGAKGHRFGSLGLEVVERRERARAMDEGGMNGDVVNALAAEPDVGLELAHRREVVVAGSRTHQGNTLAIS